MKCCMLHKLYDTDSTDVLDELYDSRSSLSDNASDSLLIVILRNSTASYSMSIASPRPEVVRALVISERFLNVAAPRPVFLNSSLNILYSFSES
jgi:hypothetical protein